MKNTLWAIILFAGIPLNGQKQENDIHFLLSSDGIQKMEFAYSNTKAGKEYVKYLLKVSEKESIIFDIGVESEKLLQKDKPSNFIICSPNEWIKIENKLKESIISGSQNINLIIPSGGNQYRVAPVYAIESLKMQGNICEFRNSDLEFLLDTNRDIILTSSDYLIQKLSEEKTGDCKTYKLRKNSKIQTAIYKDIIWSPTLGVIKESFSGNQGEYSLLRVQGVPYADYMGINCGLKITSTETSKVPEIRSKGSETGNINVKTHTVEKGETFFGIARKYQILPGDLLDFNPSVEPNKMNIGLQIYIPDPKVIPSIPMGTYVMQEGDTKEKIAITFGITFRDINQWNPDYDKKVIGDLIYVSAPYKEVEKEGVRTKGADAIVVGKPQTELKLNLWETSNGKHIVKANETLAIIAKSYGYTEERFRQMNGLSENEKLKEGQILVTISYPKPSPLPENKLPLESSKALQTVAEETKMPENKSEESVPYFDIQNGKMKSLYSDPEIISTEGENQKNTKGASSNREIYVVQQGDTMISIANKFNITEAKLREINKLAKGEVVIPRQRLFLN